MSDVSTNKEIEINANRRKTLVDIETEVKLSRESIKKAMDLISGALDADDSTWELAHHVYSALESCDKALDIVYKKERRAVCDASYDAWGPWHAEFVNVANKK